MSTDIQETNATQEQQAEAKFTQADLDRIVKDRLAREHEKYGDYDALKAKAEKLDEIEEASKSELQKATEKAQALQDELDALKHADSIRTMRNKVATDTGVPASLLTGDSEEVCIEQAKNILEFSRSTGYPSVKDGGEARKPTVSKSDILAIKDDAARLEAIKNNIELFE